MKRLAFSDNMMRALAAGEKTMTRRPEKGAVPPEAFQVCLDGWIKVRGSLVLISSEGSLRHDIFRPRFRVGDLVAATCAFWINDSGESSTGADYRFEHPSFESEPCYGRATPARVMPAALAPFVLRITEVRAEKLKENLLSESDAVREGMRHWLPKSIFYPDVTPREAFTEYWCKIYGLKSWDDVPESWVWVYGFEVAERRIA